MQQRTIDQQILDSKYRQRLAAGFWLIKHLDEMNIYEQSLITFVWLHTGTKHSEWTLNDSDVMSYMKCGRTKFYDCLQSCQTRSLLIVHACGGGQRRYRLVESNLAETMPVEAQRKYYELLGNSPREIDLLVASAVRNTDPPHGQPVRHTDAPNKEEEHSQEHSQEHSSSSSSNKLRTASNPPDGQAASWEKVKDVLVSLGVVDANGTIAAARSNNATPQLALDVIELWKTSDRANKLGALVLRLRVLVPGEDITQRWRVRLRPARDGSPRSDLDKSLAINHIVKRGRRNGLGDDEIKTQLAAAGLEWDS